MADNNVTTNHQRDQKKWAVVAAAIATATAAVTTATMAAAAAAMIGEGSSGSPTEDAATSCQQIGGRSWQGSNQEEEGRGGRTGGQGRGGVAVVVRGGTSRNAGDSKNGRPDNVYKLRILGAVSARPLLAQSDPAGFLSKMAAPSLLIVVSVVIDKL